MFSANENLALRQHKRRVVQFVEDCIPDFALDAGTCVMVMQKTCNVPGCVPLETAIAIVFPRPLSSSKAKNTEIKPLIPGLTESAGGSYKTNILKPLAEVVQDDVLDALPPELGGRRDPVKLAYQVRDEMFGKMQQTAQDEEGLKILADFLTASLREYVANGCVAPELGMPFENAKTTAEETKNNDGNEILTNGNTAIADAADDSSAPHPLRLEGNNDHVNAPKPAVVVVDQTNGKGNFVFTRVVDSDEKKDNKEIGTDATVNGNKVNGNVSANTTAIDNSSSTSGVTSTKQHPNNAIITNANASTGLDSKMAWRKQQEMTNIGKSSSGSIIQQMYAREHAPGVRRAGCPCCDPDDPSNVIDQMML
eukprot:CAMPEP_0116017954 /NCGR_PEP_ID=MMETSP0321-20121206/8362_1 /TAXON_ID=163516 /ORGANISM="Leptocylindrus danicus var. danicus, Strain B650" /LENGTH=365 /DNA_ID=CAMNT_0003488259 /DNA_START=129 /DNA_END=1223 /DNA_ORIENTATION=+